MSHEINQLGQPIGAPVKNWGGCEPLTARVLEGRYCCLEPFAVRHAASLFEACAEDTELRMWTYLPLGPFQTADEFAAVLEGSSSRGWVPLAIIDRETGRVLGTASFMRIDAANGSAEIGSVVFSPALQRTRMATEAIYLMMDQIFASRYRRCEWKCNALNAASRRAALRFGFSFEGVFRQDRVDKGRNRDTAWLACIDSEWPSIKAAIETWLRPDNFGEDGQQRRRLSEMTKPLLHWPDMARP